MSTVDFLCLDPNSSTTYVVELGPCQPFVSLIVMDMRKEMKHL